MKSQIALFDVGDGDRVFSGMVRDGGSAPWCALRDLLAQAGYALHTGDRVTPDAVAFEIHMRSQPGLGGPALLLSLEPPPVLPANYSAAGTHKYARVLTWHDDLVDGRRFLKIRFPNPLHQPPVDGFAGRPRLTCIIAGNKAVLQRDVRELYSERVRVIRWFEKNAPEDFDLYGIDWDLPAARPGLAGKVLMRLWRHLVPRLGLTPFPSYRGRLESKSEALLRTRFCICYENVRDLPGYITEKIFDCFLSGCVPVYWGAPNITDSIPADCFIDRRRFNDTAAVYRHLKAMNEDEYRGYQQRIAAFMAGAAAQAFGVDAFAHTIVAATVGPDGAFASRSRT